MAAPAGRSARRERRAPRALRVRVLVSPPFIPSCPRFSGALAMNRFLSLALAAALSSPAFAGDLVVTTSKHEDAYSMMGQNQPAKDSTEVTWIGKDHMRME